MAFVGGDKKGVIVHSKMWIMWISKKSNIDFVQFARLTITAAVDGGYMDGESEFFVN